MPDLELISSLPDQAQRNLALDPRRCVLVRAPAGSGKTTLLSQRFLALLAEVDDPGEVVAITFTNAAAAEMRNRILDELRRDNPSPIAARALAHSEALGWDLLNLPAQLRISTIDSFCRDLAMQQPVLSGLGGSLEIHEQPNELYRRAARRTLEQIGQATAALSTPAPLSAAIETLLDWRDNNWSEIEELTVKMLGERDRWMHDFVLNSEQDFDRLRARLESPLLRALGDSGPIRYSDAEWKIVRACFTLLRHAAAQLRVVFAEAAAADFTEVAQIALSVLKGEDEFPIDAAQAVADGIRHLLVDEFQDTSRRQHELLRRLIAAWSDRLGRTCFVVGDPMQSIYGFREADAELFPRVEQLGLEVPGDLPLLFDSVQLTANFRSEPSLIAGINETFAQVFAASPASGVVFAASQPTRVAAEPSGLHLVATPTPRLQLHCTFIPETPRSADPDRKKAVADERNTAQQKQIDQIVEIVRAHLPRIHSARAANEKKALGEKKEKYRVAVLARARKSLVPIAAALRKASIPFRAVDLEALNDRPEIIDALSLIRAIFNPHDRVAWLGLLRAPWCGLSLADLHLLTSADSPQLLNRPVPELALERAHLISPEGRIALDRVLHAFDVAERLRTSQPSLQLGTWLQQIWLQLGGAQCVDAAARANLDLFWDSLDSLPEGEPDLLGSALNSALIDLKAQPDPAADSDCGVQLMTIHGAKGLEFEVVIVPDLHTSPGHNTPGMLSWLERGLPSALISAESDSSESVTEFLIAPFAQKGSGSGEARKWIDRLHRERDSHEACRLLYVAATRARDELHFFARPSYRSANGAPSELIAPRESLLRTGWPAWQPEIQRQFDQWRSTAASATAPSLAAPATLDSIAASASGNLFEFQPFADEPTLLRRLPPDFAPPTAPSVDFAEESPVGLGRLYERHEGGLASRALGNAVHELLQHLAQQLASETHAAALASLTARQPRIAASIRAAGIDPAQAARMAAQAIQIVQKTAEDPLAQWILSPRPDAASEVRWTGVAEGVTRTVQVDRIFRAGPIPESAAASPADDTWWIIDYKTAHDGGSDPAASLPELRRQFAPQIEAYATVLRNLRGAGIRLCGGLYYPRMALFDWWPL
ncbi:MAG TPA: UvrD-helicase domain-containing protein [Terracidiphilus sp.]|nr:UvrD-helicase domain-containing protein [Terracidiphilus sp.]